MDKSGVFYRALPSKTFRVKGDNCKRGKKSKNRITAAILRVISKIHSSLASRSIQDASETFSQKFIGDVGH